MSLWLFFGLLGPILWGTSNVLGSGLRRKYVKNDFALTWFLAVMRFPFVLALFLVYPIQIQLDFPTLMLLLGGVLWVFPFIIYYYSLSREEPSRIALFLQFVEIFTLIISYFWLHERLTQSQWLAFALMFSGGILAAFRKAEGGKWHFSRFIIFIAIACICWAFSDVIFRKYSLQIADFWTSFAWYFLGSFLVAPVTMLFQKQGSSFLDHFKNLPARGYVLLFTDQFIGTLGSVFFAYALHLGKASLTGVLQAVQPLSAFIMALILPRFIPEIERESASRSTIYIKLFSFLLILAGLILLS